MVSQGSMYPYSRYLGLKGSLYMGTLRPKYLLYGYMEPFGLQGETCTLSRFSEHRAALRANDVGA